MYDSNKVAENIKNIIKEKPYSINKMLDDLGISKSTIQHFKTSMPKADTLAKIADYLDVSVDYLLGRTENPDINK